MSAPRLALAAETAYRCLLQPGHDRLPVDPVALLTALPRLRLMPFEAANEHLNPVEQALLRGFASQDGYTLRRADGEMLVLCRASAPPTRRRFTLAHELGHVLLCHQQEGPVENAEANCFASHLLVPQAVVDSWRAAGQTDVTRLARACGVSVEAARRAVRRVKVVLPADLEAEMGERVKVAWV